MNTLPFKADDSPEPTPEQAAEWVNALCRNRGCRQMPVRGQTKCRIVATLYAITHNMIHQGNVRASLAKATG